MDASTRSATGGSGSATGGSGSAAPEPGAEIDLDITTVAHGGVFVGRHGAPAVDGRGGRVVFVPVAIPGERVRVRLSDVGKTSFWRGEVLEVLDQSPHRQPHVWRQADVGVAPERRPGGADFGHIRLAHQRELKLQVLGEALQRFGGIQLPLDIAAAGPDETDDGTGWRTRVGLHVDADGRVGPFAARSHTVIEVEDYPLSTDAVAQASLRAGGAGPGRIDLVQAADGGVRVIARSDSAKTAPPEAREVIRERVGEREFRVDAGGFWQVHRLAATALDAAVRGAIAGLGETGTPLDADAWHLDLYGGVGLFAAAIADLGGVRVTTVESDPRATEHAGENLAEWVGARAETSRVDRYLTRLNAEATPRERDRLAQGLVVLDPPRAGAGADVVRGVAALGPSAVVYVACDPVALARDVGTFREEGYELRTVRALDLFPNSHHVEAVATFVR
ncbi:class I SAM-dependent RNA methyltransferase [Microbacterium pygmaeum]|uniref:tRNA/tmRNA/rRNA uracil-C5-methylase, TrmA/RlmC/RlmD family n=1 Tax=Microbacterium pygmaeum TaxID=370764 RepID=A0A1G8CXA0_9MICO|nr:TRAM domain-containing protein [Microbacterium pygmaeum]SDH49600.1 tRNA/tmRNA/rRNA uracil-C5-methylase, TrmA/RlmC/RlmD family [Microbacterium pygmaeum]